MVDLLLHTALILTITTSSSVTEGFSVTTTTQSTSLFKQSQKKIRRKLPEQLTLSIIKRRQRFFVKSSKYDENGDVGDSSPVLPAPSTDVTFGGYSLSSINSKDKELTIWEEIVARLFFSEEELFVKEIDKNSDILMLQNPEKLKEFVQYVTILRTGVPSLMAGIGAALIYPSLSLEVANLIGNDPSVFEVIGNDYSQYIQNILTTCGLTFSILVGQTYYFMYQQQEAIYNALFTEVQAAQQLLEQVALVCQGRKAMYKSVLDCIDKYVKTDLLQMEGEDYRPPAAILAARPIDDPFERIMFLTSVGSPSVIYQTVRSLRQARARRLGSLQRKLPKIHMILLWSLAFIVLSTFPLLGAGSQTIGGEGVLKIQAIYLSFIVFGICMCLGVIDELRTPEGRGAYNAITVLSVITEGLTTELNKRMSGDYTESPLSSSQLAPTIDVSYSHRNIDKYDDDDASDLNKLAFEKQEEEDGIVNDNNSKSVSTIKDEQPTKKKRRRFWNKLIRRS